MNRVVVSAALVLLAAPPGALRQPSPQLEISLAHGTEHEAATRDALLRLVREYDVDRWLYTRKVVIDETVIPHSHPVLTLHSRHLGNDAGLMAAFLHEEFHWLENERREQSAAAVAELRELYPDAPSGGPEGARDLHSTYIHLIVCDLERQATTILFGADVARETLAANDHYTWIYDRVLNDPAVHEISARHGFLLE